MKEYKNVIDPEIEIEEEQAVAVDMGCETDIETKEEILIWSKNERQLTFRAVLFGCLIGSIIGMNNIYMGLKAGWTEGGSILSAILAFALAKSLSPLFKNKFTILENNISQTTGSAVGQMAGTIGLISAIPALTMLGMNLSYFQLSIWAFGVCSLGIFFIIPLRHQMIIKEGLRFPTGTATAACIKAMHAKAGEALKKAQYLLYTGIFSSLFTWFRDATTGWMPFNFPNNLYLPGSIFGYACKSLTLGINLSPMMIGAGLLIGYRVGISLLAGAIICWGILCPVLISHGVIEALEYKKMIAWTIWPGVALMVSTGITALLMQWRTVLKTFSMIENAALSSTNDSSSGNIGLKPWLIGLIISSVLTIIAARWIFDIPIWMSIIAILLSAVLATIATRSTGETDINPIGGMGKVTQLVYGAISPGNMIVNVAAAGVTAAGATQAGDMMHDLKAGYLLGASPKKQLIAQLIGVFVGVFTVIPIYLIITKAYTLGGEMLPAPAAVAWSTMAKILSQGFSSLPNYAVHASIISAAIGAVLTILHKTKYNKYLPSGIGLGIAFIVPAYYSVSIFLGSMLLLIMKKVNPQFCEKFSSSFAAGGIAGEGIMGVIIAILIVMGVLG